MSAAADDLKFKIDDRSGVKRRKYAGEVGSGESIRIKGSRTVTEGARSRRELRCSLPPEKWLWMEGWLQRGVAATCTDLILLALEALHEKILRRELAEARLRRLTQSQEDEQ